MRILRSTQSTSATPEFAKPIIATEIRNMLLQQLKSIRGLFTSRTKSHLYST